MARLSVFLRWLFSQPFLLLPVTMACWSGNAVVGRAVAGAFPPVALSQLRWFGALLVLLPFAWPHLKRDWPVIRSRWPVLVLLGISGIGIFNTLQYVALNYTTAVNVLLMQSVLPLLVAGFAYLILRERLSAGQFAGIVISLTGVVVIVTNGDLSLLAGLRLNPGDMTFFCAMIFYAFYSTMLKRRPPIHWLSLLTTTVALGCLTIAPIYVWELSTGARVDWGLKTVLALAYVIFFPSTLAYICFNRGVDLVGPIRASPFFHLTPMLGVMLAMIFLGEKLTLGHALGAGFIISGIYIASRTGARAKKRVAEPGPGG